MGGKTVANDLDNARVWFDKVMLPKEALLNKFCEIRDDKCVSARLLLAFGRQSSVRAAT
jgi:hypothetical protein